MLRLASFWTPVVLAVILCRRTADLVSGSSAEPVHILFSTNCTKQNDWMSEALFYTHYKSNTSGTITRILSCSKKNYDAPQLWHPRASIHATPEYKSQVLPDGTKDDFWDFNKPLGVSDWLQNGGKNLDPDAVVVIMEPDMLIGLPLELAFKTEEAG
uniref:Uncharacterized protein n=1 Tax=Tetraselmis sp. GSL018 TaxID=582737 RepID=A0A061QK49_9CHLO